MGVGWIFYVVNNMVLCLFFLEGISTVNFSFSEVDGEKLITAPYGTDLFLLENSYREPHSYRFEDFFWTGSGDGATDEDLWTTESSISTVYKTSTVVSTVFVKTTSHYNESVSEKCNHESCPDNKIIPSPTQSPKSDEDQSKGSSDAGQQFWIVTILKSDGKDLVINNLTNSLAKLYKIAFQRQQEQHLGINNRLKRAPTEKPVEVFIHNVDKKKFNDTQKVEVIYHVEVAGRAVDPYTATSDIGHLVTDDEVKRELGVPFIIKAEPYLKASEPLGLSRAKSTWLVIGFSIVGLLIFLLVIAFIILGFTKRKRSQNQHTVGLENRKHIFERGAGYENKGLVQDEVDGRKESPTYINFETQHTDIVPDRSSRPKSSISTSSSSSSNLDISPLMNLGKKRRATPKKPLRTALNKTVPLNARTITLRKEIHPEIFDSDSSSSRKYSPDPATNYEPGVLSPKSYLSMPSVKSFPRGNMPEPLNKVLEPVSMTHLDMPDDDKYSPEMFMRHGSIGTAQDPGVIGPVVWNMHCERLKHGVSMDEGINDLKTSNISKMRKRFHDLLDDTFSLFGSRRSTPATTPGHQRSRSITIEVKSHSAVDNRPDHEASTSVPRPRPKTTDTKSDPTTPGPRGAWSSKAPSPLVRPLSAGIVMHGALKRQLSSEKAPRTPKVNVQHILAEGRFRPSDPAISVIAAIKSEIEKVSLPGSTADLTK